jgi:hypothetical protein
VIRFLDRGRAADVRRASGTTGVFTGCRREKETVMRTIYFRTILAGSALAAAVTAAGAQDRSALLTSIEVKQLVEHMNMCMNMMSMMQKMQQK